MNRLNNNEYKSLNESIQQALNEQASGGGLVPQSDYYDLYKGPHMPGGSDHWLPKDDMWVQGQGQAAGGGNRTFKVPPRHDDNKNDPRNWQQDIDSGEYEYSPCGWCGYGYPCPC
tara:strand:- start:174 stop:518 length:345 start_codon:yes stop_codon:yes gene_type:complete